MADENLNSIDEYFRFIEVKLRGWPWERRLALAVGMAERWLHVYESFSAAEGWGDADSLRRSLDAAWDHLGGQTLSPAEVTRRLGLVKDSTPHMDDFDDLPALAACMMVSEALACCRSEDNTAPAIQAVLSGFEAVLPDWEEQLEVQPRLWKQVTVRAEFEKQRRLIEQIEAVDRWDGAAVQALRDRLRQEDFRGAVSPAAKPPPGPVTVTNQWAFERYRSVIELDLRSGTDDWREEHEPGSTLWAVKVFSAWSGRYGRRQQIIAGEYGQLGDSSGMQALMERNRALDAAVAGVSDWGSELDDLIGMTLQNPYNGLDVTSVDQPHSYGPSFRRLWLEGESSSPDKAPWQSILAWADYRPPAWALEDRRKQQGRAHSDPELGARLGRAIVWAATGDPERPWAADVEGEAWLIRLNDFPDEILYSLLINGETHGDFHDWPENWERS